MNATSTAAVVGVDLSKNVFELAVADAQWRVVERARLTRSQFERWFANRAVGLVVMEACGSAHHWGRWLAGLGIEVRLLPARYVRAYVKRNKTDAADAAALIEASRADDLAPVRVKSIEQQALQALHRSRSAWMATRAARINTLRGFVRSVSPPSRPEARDQRHQQRGEQYLQPERKAGIGAGVRMHLQRARGANAVRCRPERESTNGPIADAEPVEKILGRQGSGHPGQYGEQR